MHLAKSPAVQGCYSEPLHQSRMNAKGHQREGAFCLALSGRCLARCFATHRESGNAEM